MTHITLASGVVIWQDCMLCYVHKHSFHLSSYNAIMVSLTIFPTLYLLFPGLTHVDAWTSHSPAPIFPIPMSLSPLATNSLFSIFMNLLMLFVLFFSFHILVKLHIVSLALLSPSYILARKDTYWIKTSRNKHIRMCNQVLWN